MHQNLLNAEFVSVWYLNAMNENVHVIRVMKALTKVLHKCFCCICAYRQLHFLDYQQIQLQNNETGVCAKKALLSPPL
jgi:hypothetical protein